MVFFTKLVYNNLKGDICPPLKHYSFKMLLVFKRWICIQIRTQNHKIISDDIKTTLPHCTNVCEKYTFHVLRTNVCEKYTFHVLRTVVLFFKNLDLSPLYRFFLPSSNYVNKNDVNVRGELWIMYLNLNGCIL